MIEQAREVGFLDIADGCDHQAAPPQERRRALLDVMPRERPEILGRAVGAVRVGIACELGFHQAARGKRGWPLARLVERSDGLRAALLDHLGLEAGLHEGQPQQLEAFVARRRQHAQRSAQPIERGAEADRGGGIFLALAEGIAGSESAFLDRMRQKAEKLGLKNSQFRNVTGLPDPDHKMSVRDLSIVARHIIYDHPDYYGIYGEKSFTWNKIAQDNRNPLLKDYPGADGMKTGYTKEAGYGLVGSVQRNGRRLIMVIAGLESIADRKAEAQKLLDFGFRQFKTIDVFEGGEIVSKARVWGGAERFVDLQVNAPFQVALTPTEQKTVELKLSYKGPMIAPVKAGDVVGEARVLVRGKVVSEIPVTTAKDVAAVDSMWRKALDSFLIMVLGG